ncbi:MAG: glycosyltransferase [Candidatus Diapherotrites archaeon]
MAEKIISVVVPTLNEGGFIGKCLESLANQSLPREEYEIIVSDSSSEDRTVQIAKKLADKVVVCKRVSAGFGRNFGAKQAKGKYIVFIDGDTRASRTFLEGVKESLENAVASTGPISALEKDSIVMRAYYKMWSLQNRITVLIHFPLFPGFNFAVRRGIFEREKGFLTGNITTEDLELSLRLKKKGRIAFSNKMLVYTSTRRIRELGLTSCIKSATNFLLFGKSHPWEEHRQDFAKGKKKKKAG